MRVWAPFLSIINEQHSILWAKLHYTIPTRQFYVIYITPSRGYRKFLNLASEDYGDP